MQTSASPFQAQTQSQQHSYYQQVQAPWTSPSKHQSSYRQTQQRSSQQYSSQSENYQRFVPAQHQSPQPHQQQLSCANTGVMAFVPPPIEMTSLRCQQPQPQQQQYQPFVPSQPKLNPFGTLNMQQSHGFIPTPLQQQTNNFAAVSPIKVTHSNPTHLQYSQEGDFVPHNNTHKSFVERSNYKREMCKNWTEAGFCRYGTKCQYAHGQEELSEGHRMYLDQQMMGSNDKYKSQNCRQFYREKFCPYGKRCHFRHEYRSFQKIHRHFYMAHLAAMNLTHHDVLSDSKNAPEGSSVEDDVSFEACKASVNTSNSAADLSTDSNSTAEQSDDLAQTIPSSSRLSIFQSLTQTDDICGKMSEHDMSVGGSPSAKTEDSSTLLRGMSMEDAQVSAEFYEAWSQGSGILEQQC